MPKEKDTDLLNLLSMMAFSVQRSSAGRELACQRSLSSALDRYSVLAISVRNWGEKINTPMGVYHNTLYTLLTSD